MDWLSRMETFVRVVETGSLSRAARSLRLSVPAVSRQIASLEQEVGRPLAIRTTRTFALTSEGQRFLEHAQRALREVELAKQSARRDGAMRGPLTVSVSSAFGTHLLIPKLAAWLMQYPNLQIDLRLEDHAVDLVDDGIDVAIRAGMNLPEQVGLISRELNPAPRLFVASPDYLRRRREPTTPTDLVKLHMLWGHGTAKEATITFQRRGQAQSLTIQPFFRVSTLLGLREAAIAGLGVAILTRFVADQALKRQRLVQILEDVDLPAARIHALYRVEHRASERVQAFVRFLRTL